MVDRVVRVQLVGDASSLVRAANEAASALRGIGSSSSNAGSQASSGANQAKSAWEKFKESVAGQVAIGDLISKGVSGAFDMLKEGFAHVIELGMGYEQSMNTLSAVTSASADEMTQLGEKAKQLGNDITIPGASASSAAAAMAELAKGGLNVAETMEAATGTLRLAAAAQIDAGKAAEIQANALNAFRLKADQADHVADLLANSANAASGEITDMASALQQSATVAAGFGISVDDSATTLALFAKNGILGSDAGTSFKTMLTALASPTAAQTRALDDLGVRMYSASGQFVGMEALTNQLARAKQKLTVEEYNAAASTAFGTDAIRAANILGAEGTKGWNDMAEAVGKSGGAQELAAAQSQGLTGAMDRLWNAADNVALTIYEKLSPALTGIADFGTTAFGWLGDAVGWMTELPAPVWAGVTALGAMILLKGPLNALFIQAIAGYGRLILAARGAGSASAIAAAGFRSLGIAAKGALAAVGGPLGLAVVGVTTALSFMTSATDDAATSTADFGSAIDDNTGKLKDNADAIIAKAAADAGSFDAIEKIGGTTQDYTAALLGNEDAQDRVHTLLLDQATAAVRNSDAWGQMVAKGLTAGKSAQAIADGILSTGDASNYASDQMTDVLNASARFAADSDNLSTKQRQTAQAISVAGTAAGDAAGQTLTFDEALKQIQSSAAKAEDKATPFADALKGIKSAASEADSAAQFLSITLLQMSGNSVPAEQRARANAAAFREVAQSSRDIGDANDSVAEKQRKFDELAARLGTTLDGQAVSATNAAVTQEDLDAAGRDLADAQANVQDATDKQKDALDKAAESARSMTAEAFNNNVQQMGMKGAIDQAVQTMVQQREQFILSAIDADTDRTAAEKLADAQGLIPENVRTTYETVGADEAKNKAQELNAALDKINDRTVHYSVVGGEVTTVGTMRATSDGLAAYATGGVIPGPVSRTDNTIIGARTGEAVMVPEFASAVGGEAGVHRLNRLAESGALQLFAGGGVVNAKVSGDYKAGDWMGSLGNYIERLNQIIKNSMGSISGGLNPSQNPSTFGWQRAAGIVPFSWNGNPFVGGVADRTQSLWTGLMNALVPQIPGGLMAPIWAYENRNNVNSPGNASFHSYGLAADINAPQNPNGAPGDGRSGPGVIPAGVARQLAARFGMEWGGDFRGTPDPMHFEIHVSPGQIGAGGQINLGSGGGGAGGSGVERWRSLGLDVLTQVGNYRGLSLTPFIGNMMNQIRTESGGDPNAINNYDINAQRGDPSIGLLQVIGSTFRSALRGTPFEGLIGAGQRDPRASLTASTLYSLNRYGSLDRAWRGVAYDNGGILPPGFTMAYNGTGRNEAIFTGQQFNAMAAQAVPANGPMKIEVTNFVDIDGMVSRTEVMVDGKLAQVERSISVAMGSSS